jgi:hypothetical protein
MTATKTAGTNPTTVFPDVESTVERIQALNEKVFTAARQTGTLSLDAYESAVANVVEFEQKFADASQLDWVTTMVKAHADFVNEVSGAFTSAARDALK